MKQFIMKTNLLTMLMAINFLYAFGQQSEAPISVTEYPLEIFTEATKTLSDNVRPIITSSCRPKFSVPYRDGEPIWRPTKYRFYLGATHTSNAEMTYNSDGSLHIQKGYTLDGDMYYMLECNNTFTQQGTDFTDTLTYFQKIQGQIIPQNRTYYNYHYYDCLPEGCFFTESYDQKWDVSAKEWIFAHRRYERYRDTILFEVEEIKNEVFQNGEWIITIAYMCPMTCCNDDGFETGYLRQDYNLDSGKYVNDGISEFQEWYPDGSAKECWHYNIQNDESLELHSKTTDKSWTEWHGSGGWTELIQGVNFEYRTISKLRNKRHYDAGWNYDQENDEFTRAYCRRKTWDVGGTETNIDSFFWYQNDKPFITTVLIHQYDDRGNYLDWYQESHSIPDNQGNQYITYITRDNRVYKYHELYGEVEDLTWWIITFENNRWDSAMLYRYEYHDWIDVTKPVSITESESSGTATLSIFPNPVSGIVIIAAESEIEQLSIFDITGRLVANPLPMDERVVFDTGILPQGVYLVRALLRDGEVRRGKVVVAR